MARPRRPTMANLGDAVPICCAYSLRTRHGASLLITCMINDYLAVRGKRAEGTSVHGCVSASGGTGISGAAEELGGEDEGAGGGGGYDAAA